MNLVPPVMFIVASLAAFACGAKALIHAFGMVRGIRARAEWWVNLIPWIAFALPGSLDTSGRVHRAKFAAWFFMAAMFAAIAAFVQLLFAP